MKGLIRTASGALAVVACLGSAQWAMAHTGHHEAAEGALLAGLTHPVFGLDHLLAMLASGLLAVRAGTARAAWLVPASFVGLMLVGGALAALGVPLPGAEWGIAISVLFLGLAAAALPTARAEAGALLLGAFALCHGHAHVAELGGLSLAPYALGFSIATLALHAAAIAAGYGLVRLAQQGSAPVRVAGGLIAATFAVLMVLG